MTDTTIFKLHIQKRFDNYTLRYAFILYRHITK